MPAPQPATLYRWWRSPVAKHIWSVLCSQGVLDKYTNNVSLFNVLEEMTIKPTGPLPEGDKAFPTSLSLVTLWVRSDPATPEIAQAQMKFVAPDGTVITQATTEIDLTIHQRHRYFSRLEVMPFRGTGIYEFVIEQRIEEQWREEARVPLELKLSEVQKPAQPPVAQPTP
jgi:hypothetical protein